MRVKLLLRCPDSIAFTGDALRSAVLRKIAEASPELAEEIHSGGTRHSKLANFVVKPLVFSGLIPSGRRGRRELHVGWRRDVVAALVEAVERLPVLELDGRGLEILEYAYPVAATGSRELFRTVSPVVAKLPARENPPSLEELLAANVCRKVETLFPGREAGRVAVKVLDGWRNTAVPWRRNGTVFHVFGFRGFVEIEGDPLAVRTAYEVGLGCKNALGFGMLS